MSKPIRLVKFKRTNILGSGSDASITLDSGEPLISNERGQIYLYVGDSNTAESETSVDVLHKFKAYPSAIVDNSLFFMDSEATDPDSQMVKLRNDKSILLYPRLKSQEIDDSEASKKFYLTSVESDKFGNYGAEIRTPLRYTEGVYIHDNILYGAAWNPDENANDYAESRTVSYEAKPGDCVVEVGDGTLKISDAYLLPGGRIITDTYGHRIGGKSESYKPVALAGRALVNVDESKGKLKVGDAVMTAPNGCVAKMSRGQIIKYPERIIGTVSEIPTSDEWHGIKINGRIWINIK